MLRLVMKVDYNHFKPNLVLYSYRIHEITAD